MAKIQSCSDSILGGTTGYMIYCTACNSHHYYNTVPGPNGVGGRKPVWSFNGNMEQPTFLPSMLIRLPGAAIIKEWMPIQHPPYQSPSLRVPFALFNSKRCLANHNQSLKQLCERGGIGPEEALWLIEDIRYGDKEYNNPIGLLQAKVREYLDSLPEYVCHSYLRDGKIEYLSDCTHEFASKTVELEDL